jgi:ABC-type antimicrobial peptide transport system permease subunit
VVEDQRHRSRRDPPSDAVYFDSRGWAWTDWEIGVVVRADGEPAALVEPIRRELARLDPEVPMADVLPMSERVARDSRSLRFALTLLAGSASVAVMLALVGLYGVVSWMVAQRTREIGIRLALGATRGRVLTRVLAHAAGIAALGSILGLAASAAAVRLLGGLLHGVGPGEPRTLLTAGLFLFGAALGAAWFPAWRAAALDPTRTLRAE